MITPYLSVQLDFPKIKNSKRHQEQVRFGNIILKRENFRYVVFKIYLIKVNVY